MGSEIGLSPVRHQTINSTSIVKLTLRNKFQWKFKPKYIYFLPRKCFVNYHLQHSWHFLALTLSPVNLRISFEATSLTGPMMLSWWRHQMKIFSALLPLCEGNPPAPVDSPHKGQWRTALFSLICTWTNDWANNRDADYLRHHHVHYDVTVMLVKDMSKYTIRIHKDINTTKHSTTKQSAFVILFIIPFLMQHNYGAPLGSPYVINCGE